MKITQDLDIEGELRARDLVELSDDLLLNTRSYIPWVLTILHDLEVNTITHDEFVLLGLRCGRQDYFDGPVFLPYDVVPDNYPTLDYLRRLPDQYFGNPVPMYNSSLKMNVPFSLARLEDRIFLRCHVKRASIQDSGQCAQV